MKMGINNGDALDYVFQSKNLDLQIVDGTVQKRDHFRLPCSIPVHFRLLHVCESGYALPVEPQSGTICNLSGSGLKLLSDLDAKQHDFILISLELGGIPMQLIGEIRVKYNTPTGSLPFQYGVMFSGMSDSDQGNIVRYLFHEQTSRAII